MQFDQLYRKKRLSADDAVRLVRDGDTIVVPTGPAETPLLLAALSEQRRDFNDVKVAQILPIKKHAYFDPETTQHVRHVAYFFGPACALVARPAGTTTCRPTSPSCLV